MIIRIKKKNTTILCGPKEEKLHCKVFKNPERPIYRSMGEGYETIRHKWKKPKKFEPEKEFDVNSIQFVGPARVTPDEKYSVAHLRDFGEKGLSIHEVRRGMERLTREMEEMGEEKGEEVWK